VLSWPALSSAGTGRPRMTRSSLRWCGRENQSWRSPPGCGAARTPSSTAQNSSWATTSQVPHTRQNPGGNRSGLNLDQRERTCATRGFSALRQPLPQQSRGVLETAVWAGSSFEGCGLRGCQLSTRTRPPTRAALPVPEHERNHADHDCGADGEGQKSGLFGHRPTVPPDGAAPVTHLGDA